MTYISSAIACIVARELLEGILFIQSYFGAVSVNELLNDETKHRFYRFMLFALLVALLLAAAISLGVGFGLKAAFESGQASDAEIGMEAGEGVSKLIGFFFVVKMMFQVPKWFGISNFGRIEKQEYTKPVDEEAVGASEVEIIKEVPVEEVMEEKAMAFSLFWQFFREMTEIGCLVAIEAILSEEAMNSLGESVAVGLGSAIGFFILIWIASSNSSKLFFGIFLSVIVEMLAVGLITGAVHAFEEIAEMKGEETTPLVWGSEDMDPDTNNIIKVFGFFGLYGRMSAAMFATWLGTIIILTFFQLYHNYYGHPLPSLRRCFCPVKENNSKNDVNLPKIDKISSIEAIEVQSETTNSAITA